MCTNTGGQAQAPRKGPQGSCPPECRPWHQKGGPRAVRAGGSNGEGAVRSLGRCMWEPSECSGQEAVPDPLPEGSTSLQGAPQIPDLEANGLVCSQGHSDGPVQADNLPQPRVHGVGEAQAT